jgi:fucose permease
MDPLRRLSLFVVGVTVVQQMFFSALAPILPSLDGALHLSKAQAGLLVGAFSMGLGLMALPVGFLAARLAVDGIVLSGLAVLASASALLG